VEGPDVGGGEVEARVLGEGDYIVTESEEKVSKYLINKGYEVLRKGWPDFLCIENMARYPNGEPRFDLIREIKGIFAVEVKYNGDELSVDQRRVHKVLKSVGLPVHVIQAEKLNYKRGAVTPKFLTSDEFITMQGRMLQLEGEVQDLKKTLNNSIIMTEEALSS
jgi:hypothetical protein